MITAERQRERHFIAPRLKRSAARLIAALERELAELDTSIDEAVRAWQQRGFGEEDKPMLEAQQGCIRDQDIMTLGPVLLPTDAGAIRVRRVLGEMMKAEGLPAAPAERTE